MTTTIIQGDARQTGLPDAFFHCVATSPPYFGLREYGDDDREIGDEPTPDEYIDEMCKVGREVWRVLRDDGTWWLNLGDSFASATKGGGSSSHDVKCGVPSKNLLMIPQRVAIALQADGWIIRAQIPWVKATCMPESIRDRPTVAHEYVFLLAKSQRYFWDADAVRMPHVRLWGSNNGGTMAQNDDVSIAAARAGTLHQGRAHKGEYPLPNPNGRNLRTSDFFHAGLDEYAAHLAHVRENGGLLLSPDGDPLAFMVNPVPNKLAHFAMWPPRLVAPMIKASTSEKGCCPKCGAQLVRTKETVKSWRDDAETNPQRYADGCGNPRIRATNGGMSRSTYRDIGFASSCECNAGDPVPCRVLDPFAGSGTTMQVCEAIGCDSWGVELMTKNIPIIGERLKEKLDPESMRPIARATPAPSTTQLSLLD
jgi:DNA modification methylase